MKIFKFITIAILLLINIGCSKDQAINKPSYTFTAKLVSVVSHNRDKIDDIPILYTLQVADFNPANTEFEKYNSQFVKSGDYKPIHLTKQTAITNQNGEPIEASELEVNSIITFTVEFSSDNYNLLATNIKLSSN